MKALEKYNSHTILPPHADTGINSTIMLSAPVTGLSGQALHDTSGLAIAWCIAIMIWAFIFSTKAHKRRL